MIKFEPLKSHNSFLNFLLLLINLLITFMVGVINMFIAIGLWFYKLLTKSYKYEFLYIAIVSGLTTLLSAFVINGHQEGQHLSFLNYLPPSMFIAILILGGLLTLSSLVFYILKTFFKLKIEQKHFWIIRSVSYFVTFLLLFYITEFVIFDFISRYQTASRPNETTSSYDVIIFFLKNYKGSFSDGIKMTISLSLFGTLIGLILALFMVVLRMLKVSPRDNDLVKLLKKIGNGFANIYVTVIRGTPMIVQAFIFYFLVLMIVKNNTSVEFIRYFSDEIWTPFRVGLFTVSINTTAYLTEVLRGGINSVDKGQTEAAETLGLSKFKTMILVVFPQAIKNALPSIGNEFIVNIKDTSVLVLIGVLELFSVSDEILGVFGAKSLEVYLIVAAYYLILTYVTSKIIQYIEKKLNLPSRSVLSSN